MNSHISLKEACDFILDGTHGSPERVKEGIPVLSAQNVVDGKLNFATDRFTTATEYQSFSRRLNLKEGDVLLTIVGTIGRSAVVEEVKPIVFQRSVAVLRPKSSLFDSRFLFHTTQSIGFRDQLRKATNQSSQAGVYLGKLEQLQIPLLPIAEQKRIAAILDKAEELRGLRRKALEQLDAIAQSLFLEMFGDPLTNPKGWERKFVEQIGQVITGNTPPRAQPELYGNAIEWIKSDNINTPHNYLTKASEGLSEIGKAIARTVPPSSILVTCIAGTPDCIGNAAIADREVAFNQQINALIPQIGDFRFFYTQILVNKRLIQEASTSSMKGMVSKSRFEEIQLIFPPADMQQAFGVLFDKIEQLKATHQESLAQLDALFASLQHRAFRGEL